LAPYKNLIGYQATVTGKVTEDPDLGKNGELVLRLGDIEIDDHQIAGMIWVSAGQKLDIKRSDIVMVEGKLNDGFGNFSASMYRAEIAKAQRPVPGDVAGRVRDWFADATRQAIAEPEASLGIGYLVGQRRGLPPELDEALQIAGLTHIVVASGYNLTILVRLARRLFVKVSKYMAAFSAGSMIVGFIMVTGISPSMSRAGLVAGLSLLVWYYGRKFHPLVLLPFAAAVTLLVNPSFGWNDLGWQLSFAAFAGVMILAPLAQRYFFGNKKPGTVRQILGETIAAQLCTMPILILAFGEFSNVAIVANLLVLPFVPLAMLLTFIAGVGALVIPFAVSWIGVPAQVLLQYMTTVAQYLAGLPWAQTQVTMTGWMMAGSYALLIVFCAYMARKTKYNLRDSNLVE
jgi:competence protein ComEC